MSDLSTTSIEARVAAIEDHLAIYNVLASLPSSADTGAVEFTQNIYTANAHFDPPGGQKGAHSRDELVAIVRGKEQQTAIKGGLAHFMGLPIVELKENSAAATVYIAIITPDHEGEQRELPGHGVSTGFRIHRVLVNRFELLRTTEGWAISRHQLFPLDGRAEALDLIVKASSIYAAR